ncbi:hypothetical protein BZA77DRAFT_313809 [Pyronema omphalodes]|nr:hypothetical protein BZA77DRAFT_313809 [Pyronema omphalodes]
MRVGVATTEISASIDDPFDNTDEETLDYIDPFDINIFEHDDSDENHGIMDPWDSDASFDDFSDPESGFVTASPTDSETRRVGINDFDSFSDSDDSSEIVIFSDDDEFDYNGRQARTWNTKFQHNIPVYLTMEEVSERLEKLHVTRQVLWKTKPGKVALFPEVDGISMKKLCELYRKTGDYWIFARGGRNRDSESNEVRWNRTVVLDDAVTFGDGVGDEHEGYDSVSEWDEEDDEEEEEEDVENTREREKMHFEEDEKDDIFHDAEEWLHTA